MNISTKYGFDILIISGSYAEHRQHTPYDGWRTRPGVWHKLTTGELKRHGFLILNLDSTVLTLNGD